MFKKIFIFFRKNNHSISSGSALEKEKVKFLPKYVFLTIILLFFGLFIFSAGSFYITNKINTPAGFSSEEKIFVVEKNKSVDEIAEALEKEKLIEKSLYFKIYATRENFARSLQAGQYLLSSGMTIPQIVEKMVKGEIISDQERITIIEGWNINQIAEYLGEKNIVDKNIFVSKAGCGCGVNIDRNFLTDKPRAASLEGYLFPDTYFIGKNSTATQIIDKMLDNFNQKMTSKMREEMEKKGKSIFEIVTLASIIEKEVRSDEDRAKVAGIFYKRLEQGRPLESCATISYILGVSKRQYSYQDTRISSPYNTYINRGLPIGPICSPGISSLKAAIWPEPTEYEYFLSKENGETVFSKTLEEHNANKARWLN